MQNKRVLILGAGIVGLTAAYELSKKMDPKNIILISREVNLITNPGLHYLHVNQKMTDLLETISLCSFVKTLQGGIKLPGGEIKNFLGELSVQELINSVQSHHLKTRGIPWAGSARTMNSVLEYNFSNKEIKGIACDIGYLSIQLLKYLVNLGVDVLSGEIDSVCMSSKEVTFLEGDYRTPTMIEYDYLINTIPLYDFIIKLIKSDTPIEEVFFDCLNALKNSPVYVCNHTDDPTPNWSCDFVYNPYFADDQHWYRVSPVMDHYQYEFSNPTRAIQFAVEKDIDLENVITVKYGHIWCSDSSSKNKVQAFLKGNSILLVGRNGAWNTGTLIHQAMEEAESCTNWILEKELSRVTFPID